MKITYKLLLPHLQGQSGENKTNLALVCLQGGDILTSFFKTFFFQVCMLLVLSERGWDRKYMSLRLEITLSVLLLR